MALLSGFEQIVRQNEPMAMHTWLQVGGEAKYFAEPENQDQLIDLVRRCHAEGVQVRMLGRGSNILVREGGFKGMVIHLYAPAFFPNKNRRAFASRRRRRIAGPGRDRRGASRPGRFGNVDRHTPARSVAHCTAMPARAEAASANGPSRPRWFP